MRIVYLDEARRGAEASEDFRAPIHSPVVVPSRPHAPDPTHPAPLDSALVGASASADDTAHHGDADDDGSAPPDGIADGTDEESVYSGYMFGVQYAGGDVRESEVDENAYHAGAAAAEVSPGEANAAAAAEISEEIEGGTGNGAYVRRPPRNVRDEDFDPEMIRISVHSYIENLERHELEGLMRRYRMNPHGPFISSGPVFFSRD